MAEITLENVTYVYGKGAPYEMRALDDISLTFRSGEVTGLIGHTGSGKSTLVQLLNGLLKPDSGKVLLDGKDIWEDPKKIQGVRFRVGLVMQYPEYQLFDETVESDIGFGPKNMGMAPEKIQEAVARAAEFAGLSPELLKKSPFDLSGGQKRRAALAGVMAMEPEVLVLDEPAAGLDPGGRPGNSWPDPGISAEKRCQRHHRFPQHGGYGAVLRPGSGNGKRKTGDERNACWGVQPSRRANCSGIGRTADHSGGTGSAGRGRRYRAGHLYSKICSPSAAVREGIQ